MLHEMRKLPRLNLRKMLSSLTPKAELPMKKSTLLMCEIVASILLMAVPYAHAQAQVQTTGTPGIAECHDNHPWQSTARSTPAVRRCHQRNRQGFQALLAADHRATQGRTERAAHHDRRSGLRRFGHLWRRHPDARNGPRRKAGLRYTQFHSTALCSPTRAAIITGRNHHSVGFGVIGEMSTGFPVTIP